ncbi:MAG: Gfo/Idh/MocA family oxidoreductase [Spirochaetes bacterium]|nr:Gfo/Idh/MocA family oxidoreductase [Spirochaetota bacterium]NLJ05507.1 Gfo/Idh/MocA family oxidoreductase [Exilispira sp.]HNV43220.1 Gfo/Idh/MocA family oxidoreductase [Exilispira sp.]HQQ19266.1 Gfo/Idh/MocA family oxidoreductase [Exilispira sp.]
MDKIKYALIGCGRISHKHVDALVANKDEIEAIAFVDVMKERASQRAEEYKIKMKEHGITVNPEVFDDYFSMISSVKPDLVAIATESGYHSKIAIDCLNSKINVICEKPMALSIKDANDMIEASIRNDKKLAICFQNRFNKTIALARKALEEKRFGRILNVTSTIRWNRSMDYYKQASWRGTWRLDGGTLMNQCTHNIDLLQWFLGGKIVEVFGFTSRFVKQIEAEDFGAAIVKSDNGAIGIIEGSANVFPENLEETLFISGTTGTVKIGGLAVNKIETWRFLDQNIKGDTEEKVTSESYSLSEDFQGVYGYGHSPLYHDMVLSIKENRKPYIDGVEGKKALEIILSIYKSQKTGKPICLPLKNFSTLEMDDKLLGH